MVQNNVNKAFFFLFEHLIFAIFMADNLFCQHYILEMFVFFKIGEKYIKKKASVYNINENEIDAQKN